MRKIIIAFICLLLGVNAFSQENEFTINGKFTTAYYDGLAVYLNEIDYASTNNAVKIDSVLVEGDKFSFKGTLDKTVTLRYITLAENDGLSAIVVLEPGIIELTMSDIPEMSGTVKNDELSKFTKEQLQNKANLEAILEKAQNMHKTGLLDDDISKNLEQDFNIQKETMQRGVYNFVSSNIQNEMGEFFFTIYSPNFGVAELETLYTAATPEFQEAFQVKSIMHQHVWSLGDLREGKELKGLDMKNLSGKIEDVAVNFGKGKVVLVDFWASWCGPCIKSMPSIVKVYERYKDSGFEIVGISLDENESSWKTAVKRMGMNWPQYIDDGRGWGGAAAKLYSITRIPQTYLLDKQGRIAGRDLGGVALIEKIEELLKEE